MNVPMLPAVTTLAKTAHQIFGYSVALFGASLAFAYVGHMGVLYIVTATLLGGAFISHAVRFWRGQSVSTAMALFRYSIVYLTLLFVAIAADVLIRYR